MIVIVAEPYIGFPNGAAPTSRVACYARGLKASGEDVRVILLGPSELDRAAPVNTKVNGVYQGVPFEYMSRSTLKSPSFVTRQWGAARSLWAARRRILELAARSGVDAVLLYSDSTVLAAFFQLVSRWVDAAYVADLCEVPCREVPEGPTRSKRQERYGRRFLGRFDLVVAISTRLAEYAERHISPGAEVIILPVMVDCDAYPKDPKPEIAPQIVTYAGGLNEGKDGVRTLMIAFSRVSSEFPDAVLRLVGDSYDAAHASRVPAFQAHANELGLGSRVQFTGMVPRSEVARHLAESSVLVLARPSSQQAEAGLPTKLGEYLASGRPVVVTRTSDIGEYLQDGETAYLVPPDDLDALISGLRRALRDPETAMRVGAAGRRVAESRFDYRVTGQALADAIRHHRAGHSEPS